MNNHFEEIGRVVTERAAVVKRQAELRREVDRLAKMLLGIGGPLTGGLNADAASRATAALTVLEEAGGLGKLKTLLSEFELQSLSLAQLDRRLRDVGAA